VDSEDHFGNAGVIPRSIYTVKCILDEMIGMALETGMPIYIESEVWERSSGVTVEIDLDELPKIRNGACSLAVLQSVDGSTTVAAEGERVDSELDANTMRIPMSTSVTIFDNNRSRANPNKATGHLMRTSQPL
jgi:hypothetical protein